MDLELDLWKGTQPRSVQRLLLAAISAFAELGYHGTTTRDIARRAEMSNAAIYSHYPSKADLLYEIVRASHALMRDRMLTAFAQSATPIERLAGLVGVHVETHARLPTAARIANYELRALPAERKREISAIRREMHSIMREAIRLGTVGGDFVVEDLEATTVAVLSLGVDVSRWYMRDKRLSPSELARLYSSLVLKMVGCFAIGDADGFRSTSRLA